MKLTHLYKKIHYFQIKILQKVNHRFEEIINKINVKS